MTFTAKVLAAIIALTTLFAAGGTDLRLTTALLVGALLTIAWSFRSAPSRPFVPGPARRVALWAGLYVAIAALGLLWSVYRQVTVVSLINLLLAVSVFILASQIRRPAAMGKLWAFVALVGAAACAYGLFDYVVNQAQHLPTARVSGTFTYANAFAGLAGLTLLLFTTWEGQFEWAGRQWASWLQVVGGGVAAAGFLSTASRGAFLVFPLALAAALFGRDRIDIIRSLKRLLAGMVIGVILLAGVVGLKALTTGVPVDFHRMAKGWASRLSLWEGPPGSAAETIGLGDSDEAQGEEGSDEGSLGTGSPSDNVIRPVPGNLVSGAAGRLSFWLAALDIATDYPLTGTGPGTFARMHLAYQVGPKHYASEAHSHPLQLWSETGTPGLLTWIGLVISAVLLMFRRSGPESGNASGLLAEPFAGASSCCCFTRP